MNAHGRAAVPLDARPRLSDLTRPWAIVNHEEWLIACEIDGVATIRDLASRTGSAPHHASEKVGDLIGAGLCTLSATEDAVLLYRNPRPRLVPDFQYLQSGYLGAPEAITGDPSAAGQVELLRRVLDGLKRLD